MNIITKYIPLNWKEIISRKLNVFYYVIHDNEINAMARNELNDGKALIQLRKQYGNLLANMPEYVANYTPPKKIIWWCWLQGEQQAPDLCKACLMSLRRNLPGFEVKVITEQNMFRYMNLPNYIIDKYNTGIISRTHFSDIMRTLLLVEHGGVWIDSTVYCTGYHIPIFDYPVFVYQNWKFDMEQSMVASSWLISAQKGHPILMAVRDLLFAYWKDHNTLLNYFLFHFFFRMATERYSELWKTVPRFSNIPPHIFQFEIFNQYDAIRYKQISQMSDFHKLTWKHNTEQMNLDGTYYERLCKQI